MADGGEKKMTSKAIIYVLHRQGGQSHKLAKVGSTKISAESRASNYTDGGWVSYYTAEVSVHIRYAVEKEAHNILKQNGHWLDPSVTGGSAQEIFTCSPQDAKNAVERAIEAVKLELTQFVDPEYYEELQKLKAENEQIREELEILTHQSEEPELYRGPYTLQVKRLQERIKELDKAVTEKDRMITKLSFDLQNLNGLTEPDPRQNSRQKFRKRR
jgi:cell division septum initiation protein DivIVA